MVDLAFSKWQKWEERRQVSNPGVYMIALSDKNIAGQDPDYKDAVYIGMSNSHGGVSARLRQFNRAIQERWGHSGGNKMVAKLGHCDTWNDQLYVAVMEIECDPESSSPEDLRKMGLVAYLEYAAFAEFCEACPDQRRPRFNTK